MEATMCNTHEDHHNEHNMSEAIRTVLISLVTAGVIWLVYTTVQHESKINMIDYKVNQIQSDLKEIKETLKKM
jgi:hypothetical protein